MALNVLIVEDEENNFRDYQSKIEKLENKDAPLCDVTVMTSLLELAEGMGLVIMIEGKPYNHEDFKHQRVLSTLSPGKKVQYSVEFSDEGPKKLGYTTLVLDDDVWISSRRDEFDYSMAKTSILIAKALTAGYPKDFLPPKILSCSSKGKMGFEEAFASEDVPFQDRPQIIEIRSTGTSAKPSGTDVANALRPILTNINPGVGDKTR